MNKAEQRRVMREDTKRRNARLAQEIEQHVAKHYPASVEGLDPYHVDRGITGEPSQANRVHRNHDTSQYPRDRAVGTATDDNGMPILTSAGGATVRVITGDTTEIRPLSSFKRARTAKAVRATLDTPTQFGQPECLTMAATVGYIGNVE